MYREIESNSSVFKARGRNRDLKGQKSVLHLFYMARKNNLRQILSSNHPESKYGVSEWERLRV